MKLAQRQCRTRNAPVATRTRPASRRWSVAVHNKLVLFPTGNGSCDHLGEKVPLPAPITLKSGVFEVGRQEPADIIIPVPTVSSRHALVRVDGTKVTVTDLRSTNGTAINGADLTPMDPNPSVLSVGGEVVFGDGFLARFQLQEVPDSPEDIVS